MNKYSTMFNKTFLIILTIIIKLSIGNIKAKQIDISYNKIKKYNNFRFLEDPITDPSSSIEISTTAEFSSSIEPSTTAEFSSSIEPSTITEFSSSIEPSTITELSYSIDPSNIIDISSSSIESSDVFGNYTLQIPGKTKKGGLSTGGIIALVIPCALAVIGAAIAAKLFTGKKPPAAPIIANNTTIIPPLESTMDTFKVQENLPPIEPKVNEVVKVEPPKEVVYQPYPVYKKSPPIPKVNRVFEPIYRAQKIPAQQIVEIKQEIPNISQVSQIMASPPQISQVISFPQIIEEKIPEPEHYISESQIIAESQVLPEIITSQISENKVLPMKLIPNVIRESQILPVTVLPTIHEGDNNEKIPEIINNNEIPINYNNTLSHIYKPSEELAMNYANDSIKIWIQFIHENKN